MISNSTPSQNVALSASETAELLSKELGGQPSRWATWLANDRKPGRVNRRLPREVGPGRPRYAVAMVQAFIADNKNDRLQAPQAASRQMPSRDGRFAPSILALTLEEGAEHPAVLLVIPSPLQSFIMTAEEARQIARRLNAAADEIDPGVKS